jgi:CRISPR/Cas system CSM-associated protein Csm3 (group 7 of RAMP superfamily)
MQGGQTMNFTHRYLARIIIEAETPLAIGSGERDVMTDRLILADVNGLPYIPGTSLTGVLRQSLVELGKDAVNELFGYQKGDEGHGSRLILSSAQMINKEGSAADGIRNFDFEDEKFYKNFVNLPIRQHVRMTHKGAAEDHGKFDEQVVFKGSRFCFELELTGDENDNTVWTRILAEFSNPAFRIGGGTRKGFGEILVIEIKSACIDLQKDMKKYLDKSSDLNDLFWNSVQPIEKQKFDNADWTAYELKLIPEDFFLFGSGFSSENGDADMTFVTEKIIKWENGKPEFSEEKILIPAASVKGALAHRVAFHYNKLCGITAEKLKESGSINDLLKNGFYDFRNKPNDKFDSTIYGDRIKLATTYNPAVRNLFGYAVDEQKENGAQRGNAIFSDLFILSEPKKNLLNHVAVDRFTGGAMDGALFTEEATGCKDEFLLKILVKNTALVNKNYQKAFEAALNDLCSGMLPLGGGTMRGNGCFRGTFKKN